jgi:hypothetical protein
MRFRIWTKALVLTALVAACGGSTLDPTDDGGGPGRKGKLRIMLTDAPMDANEVWVTISEIDVHSTTNGWQSLPPEVDTFDLLKLRGGQEALLEEASLSAGKYTQIRLLVTDSWLIDLQGARCEVKVPSSKVKIPVQFDIAADTTTRLVLDFDAEKSVHITKKGNGKECILRPVITGVSVIMGG